jgi:acyl-CoA synthetase (AMP-forming)/AMP-acid ligase II
MGEAVFAFVERAVGSELAESEIIAYCKERAASFRLPKYIRFVTDWPLTGSGKIAKAELRKEILPEFEGVAE